MYNVSNELKLALEENYIETDVKLIFEEYTIDGSEIIDITLKDFCYYNGKIIGNTIAKDFEANIYNKKNYELENKSFELEVGIKTSIGYEYVPFGKFYIDEIEDLKSSNKFKIKAVDSMFLLNNVFVDDNVYPMTLKAFYEAFTIKYGLSYKQQIHINDDFIINQKPVFKNATGRIVLSKIAEMFGSFAKINRNNEIEFYLKTNTDIKINKSNLNTKLEANELYGELNTVVISLGQVTGENVTMKDDESIVIYGENILNIVDNPFIYSQELRQQAIGPIFNHVRGFKYIPTVFNYTSKIYLDCGDKIEVQKNDESGYYDSILLNHTIKIPSLRMSLAENKALTKTTVNNQYESKDITDNKYTEFLVDKLNQEVIITNKKVTDVEKNVVEIKATTEKITQTVEKQEIRLEDVETELITGAELVDVLEAEFSSNGNSLYDVEIKGKSFQEVREASKNLFNINGNINTGKDGQLLEKNTAVDGKLVTTHNNATNHGSGQKIKVKPNVPIYMKITLNKSDYTLKENSANEWIGLINVYDISAGLVIGTLRFEKSDMESVETLTKTIKFTPTSEYITQGFGGNFSYVLEPNTTIAFSDIMISYDDINYEPYYPASPSPEAPSEIKSVGDREGTEEKSVEVVARGKNLFSLGIDLDLAGYNEFELNLKQGNYTLSVEEINSTTEIGYNLWGFVYVDKTTTSTLLDFDKKKVSFTLEKDVSNIRIYSSSDYTSSQGKTIKIKKAQIEYGSTASAYEPYKEERTKIILPQNLKGIGESCDILLPNGIIEKKYGYLKISENILVEEVENYEYFRILLGDNKKGASVLFLSNLFDKNDERDARIASNSSHFWIFYSTGNYTQFADMTADEFKQWLIDNNFYIIYELAEPETVVLAESEKEKLNNIKTLKGYNFLTSEGELSAKYDTDTKLNEQFETVINANKKQQINELKFSEQEQTNAGFNQTIANVSTNLNNNYLTTEQVQAGLDGNFEKLQGLEGQVAQFENTVNGQLSTLTKIITVDGVTIVNNDFVKINSEGLTLEDDYSPFASNFNKQNATFKYNKNIMGTIGLLDEKGNYGVDFPTLKSDNAIIAGCQLEEVQEENNTITTAFFK